MKKLNLPTIKGKVGANGMYVAVLLTILTLAIVGGLIFWIGGTPSASIPSGTGQVGGGAVSGVGVCPATQQCPTSLAWAGTANVQNVLNKTGVETFDTSMYFYETDPTTGAVGTLKTTVTDTSSGAVTLDCGKKYTTKVVSSSGAGGDASLLTGTDLGEVKDGDVVFNACGAGSVFTVQGKQHGLWEVRAYDLVNNDYLLNQSNHSGLVYHQGTPLNFTSTGSNTTGTAIGAGQEFHVRIDLRATVDDQDVNDRGVYVLVDAATTRWKEPTVKLDGASLSNVKSTLNPDEAATYSNYEYVFKIPAERKVTQNEQAQVDFSMFAQGGIDPTNADRPLIDFAPVGQYISTGTNSVLKVGSAQDDSAKTAVHTLEQLIFAIA